MKSILFSEECKGEFDITLPNGYVHWLKFHPQYVSVYDRNFSHGEPTIITIDLEELYEDSIEDLQRKILRKLQRDDLHQEIDEIIFNDDVVTRKSPIIRTVKEKYEGVGFKAYKKWLQENEETPRVRDIYKRKPRECEQYDDFFPIDGITLGKTSINEVDEDELDEHLNTVSYETAEGVTFMGIRNGNNYFVAAATSSERKMPTKWKEQLGFDFECKYEKCERLLLNNGYEIKYKDKYFATFLTPNKLYLIGLGIEGLWKNKVIDGVTVVLNKCPHCGSNDLDFTGDDAPICNNCGKTYVEEVVEDLPVDVKNEDVETPICPNCNSGDVENDGTGNLLYECNACGFTWGGDEEYDSDCDNAGHSISDFFDSFGFPFDKTTRYDIKRANGVLESKDEHLEGYKMPNGIRLFFRRHEDFIHMIYVSDNNGIPLFYKNLGIYWGINKTDFRNIFENLGFYIEEDEGLDTITAYIKCIKWHRYIELEIMYFDLKMSYLCVSIYDYKPY